MFLMYVLLRTCEVKAANLLPLRKRSSFQIPIIRAINDPETLCIEWYSDSAVAQWHRYSISYMLSFRAGHFRYFLLFSMLTNDFFGIFYKVNNLFLHQSYLKSPLPAELT